MIIFPTNSFPVLTTSRLILREITQSDTQDLFAIRSDEKAIRYMDTGKMKNPEEAKTLIQIIEDAYHQQNGLTWVITLNSNNTLIGTIGFWKMMKEHYRSEIGYILHPDYWGNGYMREALTTAVNYGFSLMNLHSIEANVNPANLASIRLLERVGFIKEAYFKENFYYDGKFLDSVIYSLLASALKTEAMLK